MAEHEGRPGVARAILNSPIAGPDRRRTFHKLMDEFVRIPG